MPNISDIIENFINETLGADNALNLSRNELAQFFDCAPSQINYVLSTRFTVDKGFLIESRRGGGGYVTVVRLNRDSGDALQILDGFIEDGGISYTRACRFLDSLTENDVITEAENLIVKSAVSDKALALPLKNEEVKEILRANIIKNVLIEKMRQ